MDNVTTAEKIRIKETVDGEPVATTADGSGKASGKKRQASGPGVSKPDKYIWGVYIVLMIVSCIEVFSASATRVTSENIYKPLIEQAIFLLGGLAIVIGLQKLHYKWFKKYATPVMMLTLGMLIYTTVAGTSINGANRWIHIYGPINIQPPELMKLAMVLFLAKVLGTNQKPGGVNNRGIIISTVMVLVVSGLLWINGLTNALMLMFVSIAMMLIGGIEWKKFGIVVAVFAMIAGVVFVHKYSKDSDTTGTRVEVHENRMANYLKGVSPGDTINDENRQTMYSRFALAHGNVIGNGPGNSRESVRLPLANSDYIYSIIVEDTGFVGGVILLLLYLCLVARAGRVASKCRRAFPAILIMGCAVMIVLQALVHMVIVVGIGPVSGQPLPLISKGGTSILTMSMAIGMMLSVSRFAVTNNNKKDIKAELNTLPEDLQADNPAMLPQKQN